MTRGFIGVDCITLSVAVDEGSGLTIELEWMLNVETSTLPVAVAELLDVT